MNYAIVIPRHIDLELRGFLAERASGGREAFASLLCGEHRVRGQVRLVARHLLLPDDDCFTERHGSGLALHPAYDDVLLGMAEAERLTPVQCHTHPGDAPPHFSSVDDGAESRRARAIASLLHVRLGSIVFNRRADAHRARVWDAGVPRAAVVVDGLPIRRGHRRASTDRRFDRQVRAFGAGLQEVVAEMRVGVVGVGGLGSMVVEGLARLGVRDFVLVDPDVVDESNLNRLVNAVAQDARRGTPKTEIGRRAVFGVHEGHCRVQSWNLAVTHGGVGRALATCDVLFAVTDNHASRLYLQELASAFHRPLVSAAVGLEGERGQIQQILGRALGAVPGGGWCIYCAGAVDPQAAARETADPEHARLLRDRGYLAETPTPAVFWANSWTASVALGLFHNLTHPFRTGDSAARDIVLDMLTHETLTMEHDLDATQGCVVCGPSGYRGLGDSFFAMAQPSSTLPTLELMQPREGTGTATGAGTSNDGAVNSREISVPPLP